MEGNTMKGVIIENKSAVRRFWQRSSLMPVETAIWRHRQEFLIIKGRETDGKMQPVTIMFKVAGVKVEEGVFMDL